MVCHSKASVQFISVAHSCLTLQPHALQHARLPCPSPTPRVYSNSCPLSWWCHPTISCSVVPFCSCLQSYSASGSFQMSVICIRWPKYWSFSFSISPSNEYSGLISFRMDWLVLFVVQGPLKSLLQHHSSKPSILQGSAIIILKLSHPSTRQFSRSVVSNSLWPHKLQNARPPCPSPTPRVHSN